MTAMVYLYPVLGLCIGFLSGLLGVGGGWIIVPMLNLMGMPITDAIATALAQMVGAGLAGTFRHNSKGNIRWPLVWKIVPLLLVGVYGGKQIAMMLNTSGHAEQAIGWLYVVVLGGMGVAIIRDSLGKSGQMGWLEIDQEGRYFTLIVASLSIGAGVISGLMGLGGGFLIVPMMIYVLGSSAIQAVGTSIVVVTFGGLSGSLIYFADGYGDLNVAMLLMSGSILGSILGAKFADKVPQNALKLFFGLMVISAAIVMLYKVAR